MTGGNLTITRTQFIDNTTDLTGLDGRGGAIHQGATDGSLTITDSSFMGDQAQAGGAIMTFGTVLIQRSTFNNNSAASGGALVLGASGTSAEILNSTFTGNDEGAIRNYGDTWILSRTFVNNTTDPTLINDGTLSIKNSILQRADGGNCNLPVGSAGFNIDSSNSCGFSATGDIVNTDPMLDVLQDNGGSTHTMKPQAGSPVIDSGDPTGCIDHLGAPLLVDQRGLPREVDGDLDGNARCDIGAVEREPNQPLSACDHSLDNSWRTLERVSLDLTEVIGPVTRGRSLGPEPEPSASGGRLDQLKDCPIQPREIQLACLGLPER